MPPPPPKKNFLKSKAPKIPSKNLAKVKHDMIIMDWSTRCIKLHPKILLKYKTLKIQHLSNSLMCCQFLDSPSFIKDSNNNNKNVRSKARLTNISNHFQILTKSRASNQPEGERKRKLYGNQFTKPTSTISSTNNAPEDIKSHYRMSLLLQLLQDQCHNARLLDHYQLINKIQKHAEQGHQLH